MSIAAPPIASRFEALVQADSAARARRAAACLRRCASATAATSGSRCARTGRRSSPTSSRRSTASSRSRRPTPWAAARSAASSSPIASSWASAGAGRRRHGRRRHVARRARAPLGAGARHRAFAPIRRAAFATLVSQPHRRPPSSARSGDIDLAHPGRQRPDQCRSLIVTTTGRGAARARAISRRTSRSFSSWRRARRRSDIVELLGPARRRAGADRGRPASDRAAAVGAGLLDELFLTIAPQIAGRARQPRGWRWSRTLPSPSRPRRGSSWSTCGATATTYSHDTLSEGSCAW